MLCSSNYLHLQKILNHEIKIVNSCTCLYNKNKIFLFFFIFFLEQRLVKELKEKELDSISPGLDEIGPGSLSPKIHYIIEKKFKDQPEKRKEKLRGLYKSGWEFLSQLLASHSNVTRAQFCKVAKDLNRVDIKDFLEEKLTSDDSKLNDLELDAKASLASYLSKTGPAINGWLHFADEYNFTSQQKTAIENVDKEKDTKSFSRLLLKHDDEFKVMTLEELKGICDDLDFKDIANTLDNMMAK